MTCLETHSRLGKTFANALLVFIAVTLIKEYKYFLCAFVSPTVLKSSQVVRGANHHSIDCANCEHN
jgi:hypothetical protein